MTSALQTLRSLWLVGCGNMAGAMLRGWLDAGVPAERFTAVRPSGAEPAPGVRTLTALPDESSAVQVTVVVPIEKRDPDRGRQLVRGFASMSSWAPTEYVIQTLAPASFCW